MPKELSTTVELPRTRTEVGRASELPERASHKIDLPFRIRVRDGVRRSHNWLQLVRFGAVGASGYVVNLVEIGRAHV